MSSIDFKHQLYRQVSLLGRALGHETRLELIEILGQAPRTVEVLAELISTDIKSVSNHLQILARAGIVAAAREGRRQRYRLTGSWAADLAVSLRAAAQQSLEALRALESGMDQPAKRLTLDEALAMRADHDVVFVDVRPAEEYEAGHLPGAVHAPLDSVEDFAKTLPRDVVLAVYCRGPYCFLADEAAKKLAGQGRKLFVLKEGVMEWRAAGRAIDAGGSAFEEPGNFKGGAS